MNIKDIVRSYLEYLNDSKNKSEAAMNPVCFDLQNGKVVKTSDHLWQSIVVFNKGESSGLNISLGYGVYHYNGKEMTPVEYAMEKIFEEGEVDAY